MPKEPTYRRLLKQPIEILEARVRTLSDQERVSIMGSAVRKRSYRFNLITTSTLVC